MVPRVLQGQSESAINVVGMKQAESLSWRLKKETFDHIYTSDLLRAKQTSYEVAKHHSETPLSKDKRLREQDLGDLTGLSWPDAKQILKEEDRSFDDHIAEKGESNRAFKERVIDFYTDLIETHLLQPHTQMLRATSTDSLLQGAASQRTGLGSIDTVEASGIATQERRPEQTQSQGDASNSTQQPSGQPSETKEASANQAATSGATGPGTVVTKTRQTFAPRPPRMRQINILVITHGGWIQRLMEHLLDDLNFRVDCALLPGFPKNTAVYRFVISKVFAVDLDYEWEGRLKLMNCVAHLAGASRRDVSATAGALNSASRTSSGRGSASNSPAMLRRGVGMKGSNASGLVFNPTAKEGGSQIPGSKGMQNAHQPSPAARVKSLGW
ncbi:histidine phosphatase superfamily [Fimicolochytrium jonesii]|uniref:histidine phosphatase superfamily n=1 Tax=Fimicolochytrium jonesii TaxID=1396493 RepID=UPI0022FEEB73|nr:histidine phosphatase superfamily [Fimicolochytrium jonesii]KAI8818159.1 histidine phosphatase superfamily [Fimicolochytrium jonesii]